jgi:hypothetical protein
VTRAKTRREQYEQLLASLERVRAANRQIEAGMEAVLEQMREQGYPGDERPLPVNPHEERYDRRRGRWVERGT